MNTRNFKGVSLGWAKREVQSEKWGGGGFEEMQYVVSSCIRIYLFEWF